MTKVCLTTMCSLRLHIRVGSGNGSCFIMLLVSIHDDKIPQGIVDGSASKSPLRQDTGYMVEKTYHNIAPYLGAFGAYLMPQ